MQKFENVFKFPGNFGKFLRNCGKFLVNFEGL